MGEVYYCGCIDSAGHYIWTPGSYRTELRAPESWPEAFQKWDRAEPRYMRGYDENEKCWSLVCVLDNTVDRRPGSHSTVIAKGEYTSEKLWELLRQHFPRVHARLVKGGVLAGDPDA